MATYDDALVEASADHPITVTEIGEIVGCNGFDALTRLRGRRDLRVVTVGQMPHNGKRGPSRKLYRIEKVQVFDLKQLQQATETILRRLDVALPLIPGAINWRGLHCVGAWYCKDQDGYIEYRVEVGEISPDERDLQQYLSGQLDEAGFNSVIVYTEW